MKENFDSLEGIVDDEADSHTMNERRAGRDSGPKSTGSTTRGDGGSIDHYRALQGFQQAFSEAAPLYIGERRRNPNIDEASLRLKVANLCRSHLSLIDRCLEINNADSSDIMMRFHRRALARQLAMLYIDSSLDEVEGVVDVASDWAGQDISFEQPGSERSSSDGILNVKLALLTGCIQTQLNLDLLWCSLSPSEVMIKLQKIALGLSKEVAFNWSKRAQISDQDNLLIMSLPHCLKLVELAYIEEFEDQLPDVRYLRHDAEFNLPVFCEAIADMDMGYTGDLLVELKSRTRRIITSYISSIKTPSLSARGVEKWMSALIENIDNLFGKLWAIACDELLDEISKMDIKSRENYVATHEFMDPERFFGLVSSELCDVEMPLADNFVDFESISHRSRRHLAWVWGISDSLITTRKEEIPEN